MPPPVACAVAEAGDRSTKGPLSAWDQTSIIKFLTAETAVLGMYDSAVLGMYDTAVPIFLTISPLVM